MVRLHGYALGKPFHFTTGTPRDTATYLIAKVWVLEIGIRYAFPLASVKNENGVRQFSNDLVGEMLYLDRFALEDFENCQ
ncbi:hypothetical protein PF005_g21675 [Phytophthora fragariae]|uniref:Uncharacterized protein n=1 Tax=Phytophthora fragariae TaxID=53985 RepID=A0A6A3WFZ5_9STRA|nr:hypothetical protein PF003_g22919 [Phytophthora fragariae]KAE9083924.1 hypothetical protein PF007_g21710 [Phytophthora fragariae]KAE9184425.1 hypothetical protein PF005_g21675 [Phytophthora fragariae]